VSRQQAQQWAQDCQFPARGHVNLRLSSRQYLNPRSLNQITVALPRCAMMRQEWLIHFRVLRLFQRQRIA
jgi:hypothetical protein